MIDGNFHETGRCQNADSCEHGRRVITLVIRQILSFSAGFSQLEMPFEDSLWMGNMFYDVYLGTRDKILLVE